MANIPTLSDDELLNLQASGKLSPSTVQTLKEKREMPVSEKVTTAEKVADFRDKLFSGGGFLVTPEMKAAQEDISQRVSPTVEPQRDVAVDQKAPEKVDLSELAISPSTQPVQPVQAMQNPLASSGLNQAFGQQLKGIEGMQKAQAQAGLEQADVFKNIQQEQLDFNKKIEELNQKRSQEVETYLRNMDVEQKKLEDMAKINPNKYWEEKSTGSKIAASIGIALGAIGSALTGGENQALKIINNAIDRDIDAQKNNFNMARGKLTDKQNAFQLAMREFGDQNTALMAAKSSALGVADLKLKEIAAKSQSEEAKAKAQFLSGQIMEERGKLNAAIASSLQKSVASRQATMGEGVEDPSLLPEEQQKKVVKMPNGLYKPAISADGAKAVNETVVAAENIKATMRNMEKIFDPALPYTEKAALAKTYQSDLFMQLKELAKLGVISESDRQLVEPLIADPTSFRQDIARARMNALYSKVKSNVDSVYKTYVPGYKPIQGK